MEICYIEEMSYSSAFEHLYFQSTGFSIMFYCKTYEARVADTLTITEIEMKIKFLFLVLTRARGLYKGGEIK